MGYGPDFDTGVPPHAQGGNKGNLSENLIAVLGFSAIFLMCLLLNVVVKKTTNQFSPATTQSTTAPSTQP
jgi:hypothetical protein